jgi:hypothetical protein
MDVNEDDFDEGTMFKKLQGLACAAAIRVKS